ncbi:class A beta-lactamase [Rhizobium sp. TRM95111]|uniref:class A beta-lactamase n=1 Tax=Rhizobium alarense TaxID=2846851 RepID=UPI001EFF4B9F|nr:class A beta-lactamase [Rhizobium alarense]MCF3638580.1 class A beta-lactamase [Rhizobium alarense]
MPEPITRRSLILSAAAAAPLLLTARSSGATDAKEDVSDELAALEAKTGGRLGVSVFDTQTNVAFGRRERERFGLGSTFKALAAACVLARVDEGRERLDRRIAYGEGALVPQSPVTARYAGREGMTLGEICRAAVTHSDNTAGNIMLDVIGGPAAFTAWLRDTGDTETRLDRAEPELNRVTPGDPRDTTTPEAMLATLGRLALGEVLSDASRMRLVDWMVENETGGRRLRAGLPPAWRVGDRTGTGPSLAADIAVAWPGRRDPILIAVYMAETTAPDEQLDAVFAAVGTLVAGMVG